MTTIQRTDSALQLSAERGLRELAQRPADVATRNLADQYVRELARDAPQNLRTSLETVRGLARRPAVSDRDALLMYQVALHAAAGQMPPPVAASFQQATQSGGAVASLVSRLGAHDRHVSDWEKKYDSWSHEVVRSHPGNYDLQDREWARIEGQRTEMRQRAAEVEKGLVAPGVAWFHEAAARTSPGLLTPAEPQQVKQQAFDSAVSSSPEAVQPFFRILHDALDRQGCPAAERPARFAGMVMQHLPALMSMAADPQRQPDASWSEQDRAFIEAARSEDGKRALQAIMDAGQALQRPAL